MFLYSNATIRQIEQIYSQNFLMDIAGEAAAKFVRKLLLSANNQKIFHILIVAGKGNNGGDAFATEKYLLLQKSIFEKSGCDINISIIFAGDENKFSDDAAEAFKDLNLLLEQFPKNNEYCQFHRTIPTEILNCSKKIDLIIDGIFGIGLDANRSAESSFGDLIATTNSLAEQNNCPLLALDCPSGLFCDSGYAIQPAIKATHTLTFIADKPGLHTAFGGNLTGEIIVDDLGLDINTNFANSESENQAEIKPVGKIVELADFQKMLHKRENNSHKGTYGNVGILGGAKSMVGAAILAGRAALNLGSGRVFLGLSDNNAPVVDFCQPELMLRSADLLMHVALDVLVCGPGLGRSNEALRLLEESLSVQNATKLVLDADALNLIALHQDLQKLLITRPENSTILTPHPAEAARLLKCSVAEIQSDRINKAIELAKIFKSVVILKGNGTIITKYQAPQQTTAEIANESDKEIKETKETKETKEIPKITSNENADLFYINVSGNPALATAGTGDILSGFIGALLAQGWNTFEAALAAVYLHGKAADELSKELGGNIGLTAGEFIPIARKIFNAWVYKNQK